MQPAQSLSASVEDPPQRFHPSFWSANTTELFERGAYYAMASFVVIYLGRLGLGPYWPSTLNSVLWTLVYFLPILSGTVADYVGFRKALVLAFVLLVGGYFAMGSPVWFLAQPLAEKAGTEVTASALAIAPVVGAILLIGLGGSIVKPCIAGTVQKTGGARMTLAFGIFYMVINIGSVLGRGVGFVVRTHFTFSHIFAVSMGSAVLALLVVLGLYRDPPAAPSSGPRTRKSLGRIFVDMVAVLKNPRFTLFLLVNAGFAFLYSQVYNLVPLYLKTSLERDPPVDLYTMANPIVIVCFQLLVTKLFGKIKPVRSIVIGTVIISAAMIINLIPLLLDGGPRTLLFGWRPIGSVFMILTVALIAFGELFASARTFEYIGSLAPKGQEGLFLGYANLPMALGSLAGGPVGALIFHKIICKNAVTLENGLLDLRLEQAVYGWGLLMGIGLVSAACLWLYNRWVSKDAAPQAA